MTKKDREDIAIQMLSGAMQRAHEWRDKCNNSINREIMDKFNQMMDEGVEVVQDEQVSVFRVGNAGFWAASVRIRFEAPFIGAKDACYDIKAFFYRHTMIVKRVIRTSE